MPHELLSDCRACLVARTGPQANSLTQIAERTGFGEIVSLASRRDYPGSHPKALTFFLVHRHLSLSVMAAVIRSIRLSPDDQVRFAPVILFAEDGPYETYLQYIHLGFDDVITLPEKRPVLVQRLTVPLVGEHVYFQTPEYFGPDRRRMESPTQTDSRRLPVPHSHTRFVFSRSPAEGIQIVRTDIFARLETSNPLGMLSPPLPSAGSLR